MVAQTMRTTHFQCVIAALLTQLSSWQHHNVHLYLDRAKDNWVETISGRVAFSCPSADPLAEDTIYSDPASHSLMVFSSEGFAAVFDESGKLRGKVDWGEPGYVRDCLVSNALAVINDGARMTGHWEYGPEIVEFLEGERLVRCLDLMHVKDRWDAAEMKVGCPIYLDAKGGLLTMGVDNYKDVLIRRRDPVISVRLVSSRDGHILRRYRLPVSKAEASFLLELIAFSTEGYRPTVFITGTGHFKLTHLAGREHKNIDLITWNKLVYPIPFRIK